MPSGRDVHPPSPPPASPSTSPKIVSGDRTAVGLVPGETVQDLDDLPEDHQETVAKVIDKIQHNPYLLAARLVLFSVTLAGTGVVGFFPYSLLYSAETNSLITACNNGEIQLRNVLVTGANQQKSQGVLLATMITAFANGSQPYTTIPNFEGVTSQMVLSRDQGGVGARAVSWNPVIDLSIPGQQAKFNTYVNSTAVSSQVSSTVRSPACLCLPRNSTQTCYTCLGIACTWGTNQGIYSKTSLGCNGIAGADTSSRYPNRLVPVLQIAPIASNAKAVMYNIHSETVRQAALDQLFDTQQPQITALIKLVQDPASAPRPSSIIFVPVFRSSAATPSQLTGTVSVVFSWDSIFSNAVSEEFTVVLKSSCTANCGTTLPSQTYTYLISSSAVSLLGPSDLHDTTFDSYRHDISVNIGANVNYKLSLYPTLATANRHLSNKPVIYCVVSILTIFCSLLAYFAYDWLVQSERKTLLNVASRTSRLVDSIFPSSIQQQVFRRQAEKDTEESEDADESDATDSISPSMGKLTLAIDETKATSKLGQFFHLLSTKNKKNMSSPGDSSDSAAGSVSPGGSAADSNSSKYRAKSRNHKYRSEPIVATFKDVTVFFSDIVGFTQWCSTRTPSHVFHLLETIFDEFDRLAKKRGIFKVETVGDSYVAAAGLPQRQANHAVQIATFAWEIIEAFQHTKLKLANLLGDDVLGLGLRIGINSGGVTAGVLRGERGRFQIFGDVMNTASRMETTSEDSRVQCSEATAGYLRRGGMEGWLTKRESLVMAKGKGLLQTYWIIPPGNEHAAIKQRIWMGNLVDRNLAVASVPALRQVYSSSVTMANTGMGRDSSTAQCPDSPNAALANSSTSAIASTSFSNNSKFVQWLRGDGPSSNNSSRSDLTQTASTTTMNNLSMPNLTDVTRTDSLLALQRSHVNSREQDAPSSSSSSSSSALASAVDFSELRQEEEVADVEEGADK